MSQRVSGSNKQRGKKQRKYDRNRKWCQAYRLRGQRERNKRRRLETRIRRNPNDVGAVRALERLTHESR